MDGSCCVDEMGAAPGGIPTGSIGPALFRQKAVARDVDRDSKNKTGILLKHGSIGF